MAFDITPYIDMKPSEVRKLIREGVIDFPTAGMCRLSWFTTLSRPFRIYRLTPRRPDR